MSVSSRRRTGVDSVRIIQIVVGLLFVVLCAFIIRRIRKPIQSTPNPYIYGCLVGIGLIWLWNVTLVLPVGQGAGEAIGYDLGSAGLPILLLWLSTTRLRASLKQRGTAAPYKWILGAISFIWGSLSLIDVFKSTTVHRAGAMLQWFVFWAVALVLLIIAKRQQKPISSLQQPTP